MSQCGFLRNNYIGTHMIKLAVSEKKEVQLLCIFILSQYPFFRVGVSDKIVNIVRLQTAKLVFITPWC